MFCTKCGNEIPDGAKFCTKCGTPVEQIPQQPFQGISTEEIKIKEVQTQLDAVEEEKPKKSHKKILIALVIVFVLVLSSAIGVGGYFALEYWGSGSDKEVATVEEKRETEEEEETPPEETTTQEEVVAPENQTPINIDVRQIDNSQFPEMTFYANITDESGNVVENLSKEDFQVTEIAKDGTVSETDIGSVNKILGESKINVNLVLDASGSMSSDNKINQAKNAANSFVNQVDLQNGDRVEIISFDDFVYLEQDFTSEENLLTTAINNINLGGSTAVYDALYAGIYQSYYEDGAKCVIAFTDGMENASSYSFDDVVGLAQNTGIPVYIIGIGEEYDADIYADLAGQCSGRYYSANTTDLQTILEDIYVGIYKEQQDYYVFKYTSKSLENTDQFRDIKIETAPTAEFTGSYTKEYIPVADLSGGFSETYMNKDFMIEDSSTRVLSDADLQNMSLAELRIARNEIFARHGRQFKDSMLNKWFYSKTWYLNVPIKYTPDDFDKVSPTPLSKLETENAEFIKAYENQMMEHQDIYPDAATTLLTDYDLALSKPILKKALEQMNGYSSTTVLEQNKQLVQEQAEKEDIEY